MLFHLFIVLMWTAKSSPLVKLSPSNVTTSTIPSVVGTKTISSVNCSAAAPVKKVVRWQLMKRTDCIHLQREINLGALCDGPAVLRDTPPPPPSASLTTAATTIPATSSNTSAVIGRRSNESRLSNSAPNEIPGVTIAPDSCLSKDRFSRLVSQCDVSNDEEVENM